MSTEVERVHMGRRMLVTGGAAAMVGVSVAAAAASVARAAPKATLVNQFHNVKESGAVGDGVTDDTAAITAALKGVQDQGGGTLYFPAGRYAITSTISVTVSNVILLGEGSASRIQRRNLDDQFTLVEFVCGGTRATRIWNCGLRDIAVGHGNSPTPTTTGQPAVRFFGVSQFDLDRCYIEQPGSAGIELADSYIGTVSSCRVRFCNDALVLTGVSNALRISGNRFQSNNGYGIRSPLPELSPLQHWPQLLGVVIQANDIEGNGEDGIRFANALMMGVTVQGNYFELNHNPNRTKTGPGPHIRKLAAVPSPPVPDVFQGITINGNFFGNGFPEPDNVSVVLEAGNQVNLTENAYWTGSKPAPRNAVRIDPAVTNVVFGSDIDRAMQLRGHLRIESGQLQLTSPSGKVYGVSVNDEGQLVTAPVPSG